MADTKTWSNITRYELNELKGKLREQGIIAPSEDRGIITGPHGIRLEATYNEVQHTLKVVIKSKSFYVGEDAIWEKLDAALEPYARD